MSPTFDNRDEKRREGLSPASIGDNSDSGGKDSEDKKDPPEPPAIDRPSEQEKNRPDHSDSPDLPDFLKEKPGDFIQPASEKETREAMGDFYKSDSAQKDKNDDRFERESHRG